MIYIEENGKYAEPAKLVNRFFVVALHKYGVLANKRLLEEVESGYNLTVDDLGISPVNLAYTQPNLSNIDGFVEHILGRDSVSVTPGLGAEVIMASVRGGLEIDFQIETGVESMRKDLGLIRTPPFSPVALERLLKLFSLFYGKCIDEEGIKKISYFQKSLLNMEADSNKKPEVSLSGEVEDIVIHQQITQEYEFGENNIFNKIVEGIRSFQQIEHFNRLDLNGSTLYFPKKEFLMENTEDFAEIF